MGPVLTMFDQMAQGVAWDCLIALRGMTITYTPAAGSPSTFSALWLEGDTLPGYLADGSQEITHGVVTINPKDIVAPTLADTVTILGAVYAVVAKDPPGPYHKLQLEHRIQKTVGGDNHGIKR